MFPWSLSRSRSIDLSNLCQLILLSIRHKEVKVRTETTIADVHFRRAAGASICREMTARLRLVTLYGLVLFAAGCPRTQDGLLVPSPVGIDPITAAGAGVRRLPAPKREAFSVCHGHTCRFVSVAQLSRKQWKTISAAFVTKTDSPEYERRAIARIIGVMESMVGEQIGTDGDLARNKTSGGGYGQMDCIDESSNTLTYLTLLQDAKLLRWHRVGSRLNRGPYTLVLQAPHSAAGIVEIDTGKRFAVDSWFGDNGARAIVVPHRAWSRGYRPPEPPGAP